MSSYPYPEKLKIKDMTAVASMVDALVRKGPSALQVITDFDYTLSKSHFPDGTPCSTGPGVMNHSPLMSEEFRTSVTALYHKYRPIEFDHSIPVEKKIPLMVEWYEKRKKLVIAAKVKKEQISQMTAICKVVLRDNSIETLKMLRDAEVPILIFSAGNGDIIEGVLKRDQVLFPNAHVIANFYKYDSEGYVIGYKNSTLLHVFNKNEHAIENSSYFQDLSHRPNSILLGDHVADRHMADGMHDPGTILKIGFLNDERQAEETLEVYENAFDVILIDDQTFDFVNVLLSCILESSKPSTS